MLFCCEAYLGETWHFWIFCIRRTHWRKKTFCCYSHHWTVFKLATCFINGVSVKYEHVCFCFKWQVSLLLKQTVNTITAANYAGEGFLLLYVLLLLLILLLSLLLLLLLLLLPPHLLTPLLAHSVKWPSYNKTKCVFLRNSFTMILSEGNQVI